jgi:hypothetical protein
VEETGSDTERIKTRHRSRSPHAQIIRTTRFEDRSAHNSGYTVCNPATVNPSLFATGPGSPVTGMMAWGATLEPKGGTYGVVHVPFLQGNLAYFTNGNFTSDELTSLTQLCTFIQSNGSGYGICNACRLGGLAGAKQ